MNTGDRAVPSEHNLPRPLWPGRSTARPTYALEGSVFIAGAVVQWLRDGLGLIRNRSRGRGARAQRRRHRRRLSGARLRRPGRAALGPVCPRRHRRADPRHDAAHICRAALESIAFQTARCARGDAGRRGIELAELRVDGGAAANDLLMQFQADLLGVPVVRPTVLETTALGAAYLAGLATGYWESTDEIAAQWSVDRRFEPSMDRDRVDELMAGGRRPLSGRRTGRSDFNPSPCPSPCPIKRRVPVARRKSLEIAGRSELIALFCGSASRKGATFSIDRPTGETGLSDSSRTMQKMAPPPNVLFCEHCPA